MAITMMIQLACYHFANPIPCTVDRVVTAWTMHRQTVIIKIPQSLLFYNIQAKIPY